MKNQMKIECSLELMDTIIDHMCVAPKEMCEQYVVDDFIKLKNEKHTPSEKYDFIVGISKIPIKKINTTDNVSISLGDINTLVRELCSLDKYYLRPN